MPAAFQALFCDTWFFKSVTASCTVTSLVEFKVRETGLAMLAPWIWTVTLPVEGVKLVVVGEARAAVAPPVTVVARVAPVVPELKFPNSPLAIWSPASTWKAEVLELKASCCLPVLSVLMEATTPELAKAEPACDVPDPAAEMAQLNAVASEVESVTPDRFTDTFTLFAPAKPAPLK